jgi:hypothetical protein
MPFTCVFCSTDITVGDLMVSDDKMNIAHQSCIVKLSKDSAINVPPVCVKPLPPHREPEGFLPPSPPRVCSECSEPCIAMCPVCRALVCQAFGWNGRTCSLRHEARCAGARESRTSLKSNGPVPILAPDRTPIYDSIPIRSTAKTRKCVPKKPKKKRRR